KMIRSVRNRKLFQGFRGKPPLDEEAAAQIIVALGRAGAAHPQISQIDINPLAVNRGSPVAVDAGVVLK
ncbi:MAG: acetate--CoA ligase family protein, partial [Desulfosalsimonas sp.]